MKTFYLINKFLITINLILGLTIYFGLLFMIITGFCQVIMYAIYLYNWKQLSYNLRKHFMAYGILATATLIIVAQAQKVNYGSDTIFILSLLMGGTLAFYFLYLSKRQSDFCYSNITTKELLNP